MNLAARAILLALVSCLGVQARAQELGEVGVGVRVSYLYADICEGWTGPCEDTSFGAAPHIRLYVTDALSLELSYGISDDFEASGSGVDVNGRRFSHDVSVATSYESLGLMAEHRFATIEEGYVFARLGVQNWKSKTEVGLGGSATEVENDGTDPAVGVGVASGVVRVGYELVLAGDDDGQEDLHNFYLGVDFFQ